MAWTPSQDRQLAAYWRAGFSRQRIADQLGSGLTVKDIGARAQAIGLPPRKGSQRVTTGRWRWPPESVEELPAP